MTTLTVTECGARLLRIKNKDYYDKVSYLQYIEGGRVLGAALCYAYESHDYQRFQK